MSNWINNLAGGNIPYFAACGVIDSALRRKIARLEVLGKHSAILSGYAFKSKDFVSDGVRLLRNINVKPDCLDWTDLACLTPEDAAEFDRFRLARGDVVMSMDGPLTKRGLKIAFVHNDDLPALLLQRVCRFDTKPSLDRGYLFHILHSDDFVQHLVVSNRSIAIPHVSAGQLADFEFPWVPIPDQVAISAFLGAIQHRLPVRDWPSLPQYLDHEGRIVARIEELSAKIEQARGLRHDTLKESSALLAAGISHTLAKIPIDGYLGEVLVEKPRNGWSARCNNADDGVPVLSLGAVTGYRYKPKEFKRTSEPTSRDAHYWLRRGDLLITRSNTPELVGHAAIYDGSPYPCIYPDLMMRIEVNEEIADKRFVHRWLMSTPVRDYIGAAAKGTSPTMKKISQGTVMRIPFPAQLSINEQRRIVPYLDDLQAKVDAVKTLQEDTAEELNALMPSILSKAFAGEL